MRTIACQHTSRGVFSRLIASFKPNLTKNGCSGFTTSSFARTRPSTKLFILFPATQLQIFLLFVSSAQLNFVISRFVWYHLFVQLFEEMNLLRFSFEAFQVVFLDLYCVRIIVSWLFQLLLVFLVAVLK